MPELKCFALNCSLKPSTSQERSSTDKLLNDLIEALARHGAITAPVVRAADRNIKPGVLSDQGEGDE